MNECIDGWPYHLVLKLGPHLGPTDNNHITRLVAGGWWLVAWLSVMTCGWTVEGAGDAEAVVE